MSIFLNTPQPRKSRISWARLLKRVFGMDIETCHLCGDEMKIIAAIEDPAVIKKILEHLGPPSKPPPKAEIRQKCASILKI